VPEWESDKTVVIDWNYERALYQVPEAAGRRHVKLSIGTGSTRSAIWNLNTLP
jgi:hypothetical protein